MPNSFLKRKKDENQEVKTKCKEQKAEDEAHLHEYGGILWKINVLFQQH